VVAKLVFTTRERSVFSYGMKTIGLLGGMSWESTVPYYRIINEVVREKLGGLHSAKAILYSVDFHDVERLQHSARWEEAGELLAASAQALQRSGADFLVLCTNTMHKVAAAIEGAVSIPLLHIADPTGTRIARAGFKTVGLLATRFTMEQDFYRRRLQEKFGLTVITPDESDREIVHRVIYEELCLGRVTESSREQYQRIIVQLIEQGAEAVILGCTEIAMLVGQQHSTVPLFDTAAIHARAAAEHALAG